MTPRRHPFIHSSLNRPGFGRPPLLTPVRVLTDRLLRRRGDHEDPIGAASGL